MAQELSKKMRGEIKIWRAGRFVKEELA
jgi:hypothetical protein